jgi:diguanylate cyclase (GGDEF)-like protein
MKMIDRLESIIFYFEGSCEICLANKGIEKYRAEVFELLRSGQEFDQEVKLRLYYAHALIEYKINHIEGALAGWLKARYYAELAQNQLYLGKTYSFLAVCYYIKEEKERERFCFDRAEEIFKELGNYGELANHYINILWYKRYEKDKTEIIEYMERAFDYVQKSCSMKNARVYLHLGYIYKTIFSDYTKCLGYLVRSNELCREFGFTEMESMTFHVMADVYTKIDKPTETIRIYTDILRNEKFRGITPNLKATILSNLIGCYIKVGDLTNAAEYLKKLGRVLPEVQSSIREQYQALMLGLKAEYMYLAGEDCARALALVLESEKIYKRHRRDFIVEEFAYMSASRKGDLYLALGDCPNALICYRQMRKLAADMGKYEMKAAYEKLARYYEVRGKYGCALAYYKRADQACGDIERMNQDIQYETMYKEFIQRVKEQEKVNLLTQNTNLQEQGNKDTLTNVYNRNFLIHYKELWEGARLDRWLSVMMVDIDSLTKYNDVYGNARGDEVIRAIVGVLKNRCRSFDTIVRYGGDEFLILLENTPRDHGLGLAREFIESIDRLKIGYEYFDIRGCIAVSVGVSSRGPGSVFDLEAMIQEADRALYRAKRLGKRAAVHFDSV